MKIRVFLKNLLSTFTGMALGISFLFFPGIHIKAVEMKLGPELKVSEIHHFFSPEPKSPTWCQDDQENEKFNLLPSIERPYCSLENWKNQPLISSYALIKEKGGSHEN